MLTGSCSLEELNRSENTALQIGEKCNPCRWLSLKSTSILHGTCASLYLGRAHERLDLFSPEWGALAHEKLVHSPSLDITGALLINSPKCLPNNNKAENYETGSVGAPLFPSSHWD